MACEESGMDVSSSEITIVLHAGDDGGDSEDKEEVKVVLHCKDLQSKSKYFKTMFSDRWSSESSSPSEIRLCVSEGKIPVYKQCLKFMGRGEILDVINVGEVISILGVACEWLIEDLIQHCMKFLETMPWTTEDETAIYEAFHSLQLQPSPGVEMKFSHSFCKDDQEHLKAIGNAFHELFESAIQVWKAEICLERSKPRRFGTQVCYNTLKENIEVFFTNNLPDEVLFPDAAMLCRQEMTKTLEELFSGSGRWCRETYILLAQLLEISKKRNYREIYESLIMFYIAYGTIYISSDSTPLLLEVIWALGGAHILSINTDTRFTFLEKWMDSYVELLETVSDRGLVFDLTIKACNVMPLSYQQRIWIKWNYQFSDQNGNNKTSSLSESSLRSYRFQINQWWFNKVSGAYYMRRNHLRKHSTSPEPSDFLNKEDGKIEVQRKEEVVEELIIKRGEAIIEET